MPINLTLGRRVGSDGFRAALAKWCREGAEIARNSENLQTAQSLDDLGEYVASLDLEDQVHRLICGISAAAGFGTETTWQPGESAADFRARIGYLNRPTPAEALAELAAACFDDFLGAEAKGLTDSTKRTEEALAEVARLEAADLRADALEAENERLTAELGKALERINASEEQIDHLRRRRVPDHKRPSKKIAKKTAAKATTNGDNDD